MEEPLKSLMQELGNAITDSLSESDRIAEAVGEIKRAGYNVFVILEATIGFGGRGKIERVSDTPSVELNAGITQVSDGKIKFSTQDNRFLQKLKIATDDE